MKDHNDISQELFEAIERYINGTMQPNELKDFNDYLKIDAEFKAQVEEIKIMLLGIETQSLKEQLDIFHEEIPKTEIQKTKSTKVHYLFISKIAAAAAIIIAFGSIWFFSGSPNQKMYAKYFKPDPGLATTMSSSDNFDFYDAMVNYKHKNYDLAIKKWEFLSHKKTTSDTLNYFIGVAHMANKHTDKAIPFLEKTIKTSNADFPFLKDAYYYLGLAYLKEGNLNLAKKYLALSDIDSAKDIISKIPN